MKAIASAALIALVGLACACRSSMSDDPLAPVGAPPRPSPAPAEPVTETLWGKQVTDSYRHMEALDPATLAWMKAQGTYTRSILDTIEPRAALEARIAAFTGSFGFAHGYVNQGGRAFYEERRPGSDNFDLVVADAAGKRKLVDVAAVRAARGGTPHAINYFFVSPDGSKVAVGISQGGSEAASLFVYNVPSGEQIAGPLDRADPGYVTWSNDSSTLYFPRLKNLAPEDAQVEKYRNPTLVSWDMKSEPLAVLGSVVGHGPAFLPDELPALSISPGAPMAIAVSINGVQNEQALWFAPVSQVDNPNVKWTPFVTREDGVTAVAAANGYIYLQEQQHHQEHEHDGFSQCLDDLLDRLADEGCRIEGVDCLQALRQLRAQSLDQRLDAFGHLECIGAARGPDAQAGRWLAVVARERVVVIGRRDLDASNVAEAQYRAVALAAQIAATATQT